MDRIEKGQDFFLDPFWTKDHVEFIEKWPNKIFSENHEELKSS